MRSDFLVPISAEIGDRALLCVVGYCISTKRKRNSRGVATGCTRNNLCLHRRRADIYSGFSIRLSFARCYILSLHITYTSSTKLARFSFPHQGDTLPALHCSPSCCSIISIFLSVCSCAPFSPFPLVLHISAHNSHAIIGSDTDPYIHAADNISILN